MDQAKSISLSDIQFTPLTAKNLEDVYKVFDRDEPFYRMPLDYFRRGSIGDEGFDPELSLVATLPTNLPIACILAVKRGKNPIIKACLVAMEYRRQGLGSKLLVELLQRMKIKFGKRSVVSFGASPPRYWTPGVDVRHTSLLFFLEKHGFKRKGQRQNLSVDLTRFDKVPKTEKNGYSYARIKPNEGDLLRNFVASEHPGSWPLEAAMGLENDPPTTFVARNLAGEMVGFASCDVQFPGSFGPTAVKKSLRGAGIGKELLLWTCYSQKQQGIKETVIQWVGPIKFYSKAANAYHSQFFVDMRKKF